VKQFLFKYFQIWQICKFANLKFLKCQHRPAPPALGRLPSNLFAFFAPIRRPRSTSITYYIKKTMTSCSLSFDFSLSRHNSTHHHNITRPSPCFRTLVKTSSKRHALKASRSEPTVPVHFLLLCCLVHPNRPAKSRESFLVTVK
jgi:hypothetical protein